MTVPTLCPECQSPIKEKSGISRKDKPYHFFGCSAWPKCTWVYQAPKTTEEVNEEEINKELQTFSSVGENSEAIANQSVKQWNANPGMKIRTLQTLDKLQEDIAELKRLVASW